MEPTAHPKLHGLDHLRAFAIFAVFLFHYFILSGGQPEWLPAVAKFGWTGVDLFFVLSGFLISSQLFEIIKRQQKISLKQFFLKRFFRIVPAFLVTVAIYFSIPFFREKESLPPLWKFLTFTQNFALNIKDQGTFSHAWSLCVEEHFYLILPLALLLLQGSQKKRNFRWIFFVLILLGFAARIISYRYLYMPTSETDYGWMIWYKSIYYPTYSRLDALLAGVSIAALYHFRPIVWKTISGYGNLFLSAGVLILTGAWFLCADQMTMGASVFGFPLVALGYGSIVLAAVSPSCILFKLKSAVTTFIAGISYSVYLTHKGVVHVTHQLLTHFHLHPALMLVICMLTCMLAAFVLHLIVEQPFMKLRKRIVGNKGSDASAEPESYE